MDVCRRSLFSRTQSLPPGSSAPNAEELAAGYTLKKVAKTPQMMRVGGGRLASDVAIRESSPPGGGGAGRSAA